MKNGLCLCIAICCLVSSRPVVAAEIPVVAPKSVRMSADKLSQIDTVMAGLVEGKRLAGGVVLVSRKGQIVYLKAFGHQDVAAGTPMSEDTIFRIYSMSKAITSAAVMMLVDEGKVRLDAPVSDYIPEFADVKVYDPAGPVAVTRPPAVRDLLLHSAGLTYGLFGNSPVDQAYRAAGVLSPAQTLEAMAAKVGKLPLEYQPGQGWKYSVATDVLGRIVEVGSGMKFSQFLQQRLFEPLAMHDTAFHVPAEKLDRLATNYNSTGDGTLTVGDLPATSSYRRPPVFESGGGGLVSTIRDYHRFLLMILQGGTLDGKRLLSEESVKLMTTNQLPAEAGWVRFGEEVRKGVGFGLGFSVRTQDTDWDPAGRTGEYGWGGAASTHYWVSPKDELIVVTMEQVMPYSFMTEFALKPIIYDSINP